MPTHQNRARLHDMVQLFNSDGVGAAPVAPGTLIDSLGLFGHAESIWNSTGEFPHDQVRYHDGYTEAQIQLTYKVIVASRDQGSAAAPVRASAIGAPHQAPRI